MDFSLMHLLGHIVFSARMRVGSWFGRLVAPRLTEEDDRRKEHILNILLVGSIALLIFLDGVVAYYFVRRGGGAISSVSLLGFTIFLGFFVFLYVLSRRGSVFFASYALVVGYFIANGYAAYRWGVMVPTVLVGYALLIVIAGIVVGSRFGFMTSFAITAFTIPVWLAQDSDLISIDPEILVPGDTLALGALYMLIMTVAWLSNREIERSLIRARTSEYALVEQRDHLEVEVEERTRELREAQFAKVEQLYSFAQFGQMASGLFHDLVNFFNAVLLHMQQPGVESHLSVVEARDRLEMAGVLTKQVNDFVEATRKQLVGNHPDERFSVGNGIGQIVQFLSYVARKQNVSVIVKGNDAFCFGNCFKFHQAMMNLILNAIESYDTIAIDATKERSVMVTITPHDDRVEIGVADYGAGIAERDQEHIFQPFFSTKIDGKGMGLGLAITKKIIENDFYGTLTLTSVRGRGTAFVIRIPSV